MNAANVYFYALQGASRMNAQIRQWDAYDRGNANGRFVPEWKVQMPGIFSANGVRGNMSFMNELISDDVRFCAFG